MADFFHIYRDRSNFVYQLDITRDDEAAGEFGQKYTLCVSKMFGFAVFLY